MGLSPPTTTLETPDTALVGKLLSWPVATTRRCLFCGPVLTRRMPAVLDQPEGPASFATAAGHRYKGEEIPSNKNSAGVLVQSVNHATGENTWKVMPEDYDYNQELARAAFADFFMILRGISSTGFKQL